MSFQIGDSIGDYQIIGVLGAGGMGKVYKVKNLISDRIDALKILLPNLADDPELADRFIREIKVLASLNHPNIAGLRTAFRLDNQLLMVMEYVEGTTLDERTKAGAIPVKDAINYITQALSALGYAHKQGIIHRDIKPANMMLTPDNVIKLMDFGIAKTKSDKKLTQTGTTMGSLFYMSAEQVQGNELDGRSDLYSVGVSLYEMVTGTRPFQGKSDFEIMVAQLQQVPMAPMQMMPDLPKSLNDIIMISLEKDPAKRFQTAEALAAALGSIGGTLNATPMQPTLIAPTPAGVTQTFGSVPPVFGAPQALGSATGLIGTQASAAPAATGGSVPPSGGFLNTASTPTVMASDPSVQAVQAQPPSFTPPTPSHGVPQAQKSKSYTGLYMTLGALVVVAGLVVAGVLGTRFWKARASGEQSAQTNTTTTATNNPPAGAAGNPSTDPNSTQPGSAGNPSAGGQVSGNPGQPNGNSGNPNTGDNSAILPATGSGDSASLGAVSPQPGASGDPAGNANSSSKKSAKHNSAGNIMSTGGQNVTNQGGEQYSPTSSPGPGGQVVPPPSAMPPGPSSSTNPQEMEALTDQHEKLSARAQAANDSVEGLRRQMASSGNNLRSDISAAQSRMKMYMDKSDAALNSGNADAAKKYMGMAEREVEKLEAFFGH